MRFDTTLREAPRKRPTQRCPTLTLLATPGVEARTGRCGVRPAPGLPIPLAAGATQVGRAVAEDEGIALPTDPRVSRQHVRIEVSPAGSVRLVDESSTFTSVNGQRVEEADLHEGDLIRVGDSFFLFRAHDDGASTTAGELDPSGPIGGLLGQAPSMRILRKTLGLVGRSNATVLLLGATGTGKELAARAVHDASQRSGAFVAINCSAIPEALAESQLFGHVAGSFTGATTTSPGVFRAAEGGTLFLDEVGEMPGVLQPKLLRALEEREVLPVGATRPVPFDAQVVAATNRDLREAASGGGFRGDLYARLAEFTIEMPRLCDRREDILPLFVDAWEGPDLALEADLAEALLLHEWPFNVRELRKLANQLCIRLEGATWLGVDALQSGMLTSPPAPALDGDLATVPPEPCATPGGDSPILSVPDRDSLNALMRRHNGVVADVARETGRSRKQVYRWLRQYEMDPADYRT